MVKVREAVTTNGRAAFYASIWNDFRQAAMDKGWALGLHGSLAADMDIMAMPWVEGAASPNEMINALRECFTEWEKVRVAKTTDKPNNRVVYTLSIWSDFYLDINIINSNHSETGTSKTARNAQHVTKS